MKKAYVYIVLVAVIFSTMEIAGRHLGQGLNATQINFWRFFIGALILLPTTVKRLRQRGVRLDANDFLYFFVAALVGIVISMWFYQTALIYAKASVIAVIVCSCPVIMIPFACIFLREKFTGMTALSLAFCLMGVFCLLNPARLNADRKGILLGIGCAVTFALYSVIGKRRTHIYGGVAFTCLSFLSGAATMLAVIALSNIFPIGQFSHIPLIRGLNSQNLLPLLYFGIVGTGLSYMLYFAAMEISSAAIGSVAFFIKPALAPILAFLVLGERISTNVYFGIAFMVLGSYFVFRQQSRPAVARSLPPGAPSAGIPAKPTTSAAKAD